MGKRQDLLENRAETLFQLLKQTKKGLKIVQILFYSGDMHMEAMCRSVEIEYPYVSELLNLPKCAHTWKDFVRIMRPIMSLIRAKHKLEVYIIELVIIGFDSRKVIVFGYPPIYENDEDFLWRPGKEELICLKEQGIDMKTWRAKYMRKESDLIKIPVPEAFL